MKTDGFCCQTAKDQDSRTLICFVGNVWYQLGNCRAHPHCIRPLQTPLKHSIPVGYMKMSKVKNPVWYLIKTRPSLSLLSRHQSWPYILISRFPFSSPDSGRNASRLTGCWCLSFFHFSCCAQWSPVTHGRLGLPQCHQHPASCQGRNDNFPCPPVHLLVLLITLLMSPLTPAPPCTEPQIFIDFFSGYLLTILQPKSQSNYRVNWTNKAFTWKQYLVGNVYPGNKQSVMIK